MDLQVLKTAEAEIVASSPRSILASCQKVSVFFFAAHTDIWFPNQLSIFSVFLRPKQYSFLVVSRFYPQLNVEIPDECCWYDSIAQPLAMLTACIRLQSLSEVLKTRRVVSVRFASVPSLQWTCLNYRLCYLWIGLSFYFITAALTDVLAAH